MLKCLMLKGFNILLDPGAFSVLSFHYFGGDALFFLTFCFECDILYLQCVILFLQYISG